ncbi:MAG: Single-stranded-DNA-specific exonuclease RecJ [Parcubacteria group bacterium GW2011_GWA2_39_18]|nr:MAG: Single-stranded-DNA-specific exonuclease RecJ [Parcubacteria group bacterium GW2011_GWA2_39_18]
MEGLNHTERIGLQELIKIAGIENRKISTYEVGWMLGPRLNAMGRLESALDSLRLLCTRDRERARELAQKLNEANYQRQEMTKKAVEQARQMVLRSHLLRGDAEGGSFTPDDESGAGVTSQENTSHQLIILSHSDWHEGIIGLIASKMTEEFGKPTLAISQGETISKGSARSIEGFNLVENLRLHQDLLINVGGHPMAAGLTIETAKITEFSNRFSDNLSQASQETSQGLPLQMQGETLKNKKAVPQQKFKVDLNLPFEKIDFNLYQELQQLEPFGLGNPQPLFQTNNLIINDLRLVGKEGQHLKLKVGDDKASILDSIGFSLGFWANEVKVGDKINLIYYLEKDDFNGNQKVQLRIKSIEKNSLQK